MLYAPGRHTVRRLAKLGVRRISTGSLLFRAALHAATTTATAIRDGEPVRAELPGYTETQRLGATPTARGRRNG